MKKLFTFLATVLLSTSLFAQSPDKMSYQSVIRDANNTLLTNQKVGMQISILQGATPVYVETQTPSSNINGLVTIEVGVGSVVSGSFASIDWSAGQYSIKTETDPSGGSNYTITGTSPLLSVPYALHAKTADTFLGVFIENDPVFANSEASKITNSDISNLSNLSGINTGDQDISGIAKNTQAIQDTAAQIRADIPKIPSGSNTGDILYWDGTKWAVQQVGSQGQVLTVCGGQLVWTTNGLCPPPPFVCGTSSVTFTYNGNQVTYGTVVSNGKCWLDRNLGASQVATASTDAAAYGDLFQWGREDDGHQDRSSVTTSVVSNIDKPGHKDFISGSANWRSPKNDNLWQGINGINNPCPDGFHVPTEAEWQAERITWSSLDAPGALASPLKLPLAGFRRNSATATLGVVGTGGRYWSSTTSGIDVWSLVISATSSNMGANSPASGMSVRCIKD